jgi:MYXO-CTERM domain-containing protein
MKLTTKYTGMLDFGLIMFPDQTGQSCVQDGPIYVNVAAGNESKLVSTVTGTKPNGPCVTPIKPAIDQVATDPVFASVYQGMGPRSFVLFISDGMQTCGGSDAQITASFAKLYADGYPSYIVGFGGQVAPAALDMFAQAGGVPRTVGVDGGGRPYYQADDAAGLDAALDEIVGNVVSAEFSSCPGTPCPDGRCFVAGQQCSGGVCVGSTSGGSGDGGADDGGGGGSGAGGRSGCSCRVGDAPLPASAGLLLLALPLVARLRRQR